MLASEGGDFFGVCNAPNAISGAQARDARIARATEARQLRPRRRALERCRNGMLACSRTDDENRLAHFARLANTVASSGRMSGANAVPVIFSKSCMYRAAS